MYMTLLFETGECVLPLTDSELKELERDLMARAAVWEPVIGALPQPYVNQHLYDKMMPTGPWLTHGSVSLKNLDETAYTLCLIAYQWPHDDWPFTLFHGSPWR
jgi:hypothetical protein